MLVASASLQSDMRLGYFGGSFDPPHLGHLAVARAAADNFQLNRVLLVPTGSQPLKPNGMTATYAERLAMVTLLCNADERLQASDLEAPKEPPAPNYTIDTLQGIRAAQPDADLFVIVGADAFHQLPLWRSPEELLTVAEWIVVTRPSGTSPADTLLPPLTREQCERVHLLATVDHPASATAIRMELAGGGTCADLLSPALLGYIREHRLYT